MQAGAKAMKMVKVDKMLYKEENGYWMTTSSLFNKLNIIPIFFPSSYLTEHSQVRSNFELVFKPTEPSTVPGK